MINEKHFITLPYGAFTDLGTINESPFFPGRHTYQLASPGENGELHWLEVTSVNGLLYPRFTTEETIIREFGVFQEGGTTVLLKAPVRNLSLDLTIKGTERLSYADARLNLAYIINWAHVTASTPPEFETINEIYNISTIWGRPNAFTYTIIRPNGVAYHIDFFPQTPDPQEDVGNPDAESLQTSLRITADSPSIYGDPVEVDFFGKIGKGDTADPETSPIFLLDTQIVPGGLNYSSGTRASARTGFLFEIDLRALIPLPTTLYSFGVYEVNTGKWARFKYWDYPNNGWTVPSGYRNFKFDSVNRTFIMSDGVTPIALDRDASPQSIWDNFLLSPGKIYQFFLEINVGASSQTNPARVTYRPRWAGI